MGLKEKISLDMRSALKNGEKLKVSVLRMSLAQIKKDEIDKMKTFNDEEIIGILTSQVKKYQEAISMFEKGGRDDLVRKETEELKILQGYLPEPLSDDKILNIIEETIKEVQASELKDLGKVMKAIIPKTKGQADSAKISALVKNRLAG
ncbi:MAG: GatB/YqeY domain-containing protein [Candidatus Firestonebacteria bacterium]|nr:GatB/YqeY domain-containing protein [Candidatus Firestonebacteria bacterium]